MHDPGTRNVASWKVEVLGYFLESGNGPGGRVHVKPGPKRFYRFNRELIKRLAAAGPSEPSDAAVLVYFLSCFFLVPILARAIFFAFLRFREAAMVSPF
jgi:hypothetical protein